jgi:hypothetical protein
MSETVASGEVVVRDWRGNEWTEIVDVRECDLTDTDGSALTVEDAARRQAWRQAGGNVETLECDIS